MNYESSRPYDIKKFFENADNYKKLKEECFVLGNKIEELDCYHTFLIKYEKWLVGIDDLLSNSLKKIANENKDNLNKIMVVSKILNA